MGYYINLSKISLEEFKNQLENTDLLPSQQILKKDMNDKFKVLNAQNLNNMYEIQQALKTKDNVNKFSKLTGISVDYLTILRREVNSYHPQSRRLKDFIDLNKKTKKNLDDLGIKNTLQLYERVATKDERDKLKKELNISGKESLLLAKLTDLSRLRYVNQAFATLLVNSDYDTVEKIQNADYEEIYEQLTKLNEEKRYYKGKIHLKDMKFLVNDAVKVSLDIEY